MIAIKSNDIPLDFDVSLTDFLRQFLQSYNQRTDRLTYNYQDILTIREDVGTTLLPQTLIYYPELGRQLRKLRTLDYEVSLNLKKIESSFQKGLASMINSLKLIQAMLYDARCEKAQMDARVNNLIYLYGQEKTPPILRTIKPYFYNRRNHYNQTRYILNISGINYYLHYHGSRFDPLKGLYSVTPHQLLNDYFETTRHDASAVSPCATTDFIGGIINTPIFAFRVRQSFRHRGKNTLSIWPTSRHIRALQKLKKLHGNTLTLLI